MRLKLAHRGRDFEMTQLGEQPLQVRLREGETEKILELLLKEPSPEGRIRMEGRIVPYFVTHEANQVWVTLDGRTFCFKRVHGDASEPEELESGFNAPMPGKVIQVNVEEGQEVEKGTVLILLEAMKMEHRIVAPSAGKVTEVFVKNGDLVNQGFKLIHFEPAG